MSSINNSLLALFLLFFMTSPISSQVNWQWNEELLESIRNDIAKPVVHSRNLYHHSLGMYNLHDEIMLGGEGQLAPEAPSQGGMDLARAWTGYSYAFISARYANAPGWTQIENNINDLTLELHGQDWASLSADPSALYGYNYGLEVNAHFMLDGANQTADYANTCYTPSNDPVDAETPGSCTVLDDAAHWQPLAFGATGGGGSQDFLGANWGDVLPFSLDVDASIQMERDGCTYRLYADPGAPEYLGDESSSPYSYINGFTTVVNWQQHLNPDAEDDAYMDISPKSQGNFGGYPDVPEIYYDMDGPNLGAGHAYNPITSQPYEENLVLRSDFTRVLPEFWADGPNSETPPGHWFSIMNHDVYGTPDFLPRWKGEVELTEEEWLARAYLLLGGAFHDVSITTWGIKAYYDFIRPISAIRHMQSLGQSTDPSLPSYHEHGLPLMEGVIEVIESGDPILADYPGSLGDIKIKQWIPSDTPDGPASFDWRPGCHWLPYQLPSFVTPPFAGYVSGHSTFSAAAAELLATMTGSAFFPGGMGSFTFAPDYLNFDVGPSVAFELQWATYKDAADQSGLSRIWGGIHPPVDDVRGRIIGDDIAQQCLALGADLFEPKQDGCTYSAASNYDSTVSIDDGSCVFAFNESCSGDANFDGAVSSNDILTVLAAFGSYCE